MFSSLRLFRYLRPYWVWALLAPLFMVLEVGMDLLQPRFIQRIVDEGVAKADFNVVTSTGAMMIVIAIIGLIGGMGCTIFAIKAGQAFGADLRADLFRKVQSLSFANLDNVETGGLITRLTNDVTQVTEMMMMLMRIMVRAPLLLFGSLILAVLTSPSLGLLFVALIPIVVVILAIIIRKTFPLFSRVQARLDALNTVLQENLAGVRVVKSFARAAYELMRFGRANDALMSQNITAVRTSTITMPLMMLTVNAGLIAALWMGGQLISTGGMQVGQLIAFVNYLVQALLSLMQVSMLMIQLSRAQASMQRVSEVLDSIPAIQNTPDAQPLPKSVKAALAFENVSFGYNDTSREPVLKNISFEAEPGQTVAILGATGAGKSTLVQLIPRYYDVANGHGRILLDGTDIRQLREEELRKSVGVALQESILFSGSIRDNIKYGSPDASDEDVLAAAKAAQADEFIQKLPEGYDTQLGQRGVNLSGGQKQRIAIARALLPQPSILILDDSTSAVDVRTEAEIQRALQQQMKPQTRFIVAQRISSVVNADKILVLDNGAIAAEGTHDELMQRSPIYREIYDSQMQNGVIDQSAE